MGLRFRLGPFTFGKSGMRLSLWSGGSGFSTPIFNRNAQSYGKIKFGIFSYFFTKKAKNKRNKKVMIEKNRIDNYKQNYQDIIKKTHSQAYEPWSEEADRKLTLLFHQGKTVKELSEIFGRTKGAIRSRIQKLLLE